MEIDDWRTTIEIKKYRNTQSVTHSAILPNARLSFPVDGAFKFPTLICENLIDI